MLTFSDFLSESKAPNLLDRSRALQYALTPNPMDVIALQRKIKRDEADRIRQFDRLYGHMSDQQLVDYYIKLAKQSGDKMHISNSREHKEVLEDGGLYDRHATYEGINAVIRRGK